MQGKIMAKNTKERRDEFFNSEVDRNIAKFF